MKFRASLSLVASGSFVPLYGAIATSLFCRSKGADFSPFGRDDFLCSMTLNRLTRDL